MDKRTVASAHERIDGLEKEVIAMQTEMRIQFKDLFGRVKRMEAIMIGTTDQPDPNQHESILSRVEHDLNDTKSNPSMRLTDSVRDGS